MVLCTAQQVVILRLDKQKVRLMKETDSAMFCLNGNIIPTLSLKAVLKIRRSIHDLRRARYG